MPDPISAAREAAIRQAYKLEHQLYQVENTSLAEIRAELEVTRRSVLSVLATATKDWQISQAQGMLVEIERQIKAWAAFSTSAIGSRFPTVADIGVEQVTAALKAGGTSLSIGAGPMLSRDFIAVAYQSLPLMVTDISTEATTKIGRILRQSVLAQRTPLDAMQEIGTITGKGVFNSAFLRGETILRTEYGRICQTANYAALSDVAQDNPTLRKEWSAVIDRRTRPTHAAADGEIRDVDKTYEVGGNPALYPHDPQLPASESIHCRCISVAQDASWPQDRTKSTQVPATSLDIASAPAVSSGQFKAAFDTAFPADSPRSAFVTHYSEAEIAKMTPMLVNDGKTGLLIHDHGDGRLEATAVFNVGGPKGAGSVLLKGAAENGSVNYLECYGDVLREKYEAVGFKVTDALPFDPVKAKAGWNYARDGSPTYYIMRYQP